MRCQPPPTHYHTCQHPPPHLLPQVRCAEEAQGGRPVGVLVQLGQQLRDGGGQGVQEGSIHVPGLQNSGVRREYKLLCQ